MKGIHLKGKRTVTAVALFAIVLVVSIVLVFFAQDIITHSKFTSEIKNPPWDYVGKDMNSYNIYSSDNWIGILEYDKVKSAMLLPSSTKKPFGTVILASLAHGTETTARSTASGTLVRYSSDWEWITAPEITLPTRLQDKLSGLRILGSLPQIPKVINGGFLIGDKRAFFTQGEYYVYYVFESMVWTINAYEDYPWSQEFYTFCKTYVKEIPGVIHWYTTPELQKETTKQAEGFIVFYIVPPTDVTIDGYTTQAKGMGSLSVIFVLNSQIMVESDVTMNVASMPSKWTPENKVIKIPAKQITIGEKTSVFSFTLTLGPGQFSVTWRTKVLKGVTYVAGTGKGTYTIGIDLWTQATTVKQSYTADATLVATGTI